MRRAVTRTGAAAVAIALAALAACAPKPLLTLPSGTGQATTLESSGAGSAFESCGRLQSLTAEIGIAGRAGRQRLRGRLIAGFVRPESVRLEAVAPFGPPVFILVSSPADTTLLLPRDRRVLRGSPPADILDALAGVSLTPGALLARLGGCPSFDVPSGDVRAYGPQWISIAGNSGTTWLHRSTAKGNGGDGAWQIAALTEPRLRTEFERTDDGKVRRVHLVGGADDDSNRRVDLTLTLSQVETNVPVPAEAFTVAVPDTASPITLDELRQSGPMRDEARSGTW